MIAIDNADLSLVRIRYGTPHCVHHGAMLKVSKEGIWRCTTDFYMKKNDEVSQNQCKAGCKHRVRKQ